MDKYLRGTVDGGGATGTVQLNTARPRPSRQTAVSVTPLEDGPYDYFDTQAMEDLSVAVLVTAGGATVALQGTNGDPNDAATAWLPLDTTAALTLGGTDSDLLTFSGAIRFARIVWTSGTTLDMTVEVYARG